MLYLISLLPALFENFTGMKFLFFDFDGYHGFLIKILLDFFQMRLFSQLHRTFFLYFANRAIILTIFEKKGNRKAFIVI